MNEGQKGISSDEDATPEMLVSNDKLVEAVDSKDKNVVELVRRFKLALRQLEKPQLYTKKEYGNLGNGEKAKRFSGSGK